MQQKSAISLIKSTFKDIFLIKPIPCMILLFGVIVVITNFVMQIYFSGEFSFSNEFGVDIVGFSDWNGNNYMIIPPLSVLYQINLVRITTSDNDSIKSNLSIWCQRSVFNVVKVELLVLVFAIAICFLTLKCLAVLKVDSNYLVGLILLLVFIAYSCISKISQIHIIVQKVGVFKAIKNGFKTSLECCWLVSTVFFTKTASIILVLAPLIMIVFSFITVLEMKILLAITIPIAATLVFLSDLSLVKLCIDRQENI